MIVNEIPIKDIDISEFNTRKNLEDGQFDSSIEDLAQSIKKQGLLQPITVFQKSDGRYSLVAGQRRLLAYQKLGRPAIPDLGPHRRERRSRQPGPRRCREPLPGKRRRGSCGRRSAR